MGELGLLGYPIMTIPVRDKFAHKSGRLFHLNIQAIGKSRYTRRFIPAKVRTHPPQPGARNE